jgi:hypothetical protein
MVVDHPAQVRAVADAYRETLRDGDQLLQARPVEKRILLAIVASSAVDTSRWVQTRMPAGVEAAKPLEDLVPALQAGNKIGKSLQSAKEVATKEAKSAVLALAKTGSAPLWLTSLLSFFAGVFSFTYQAGSAAASAIIPVLLGGGAAAMAVLRVLQAAPAMGRAVGAGATSLLSSIDSVGASAEGLFADRAKPVLDALYSGLGARPAATPIVGQLRSGGRVVVLLSYGFVGACCAFFVAGAWHAVSEFLSQQVPCLPPLVRSPNGTCT